MANKRTRLHYSEINKYAEKTLYKVMAMLPSIVVALRGAKQVGALSSAE